MMAKLVDFKPEHLKELLEEDATSYLRPYLTDEMIDKMGGPLMQSIESNGRIVATGGVSMYWPNRGEAWVFFASDLTEEFVPVFRKVKQWLDNVPVRRLEAAVDVGDDKAARWVEALGFEIESHYMRKYRPDGGDCALYAKVK